MAEPAVVHLERQPALITGRRLGRSQATPQRTAPDNPTKLRVDEIAHAVKSSLEMDDRGFVTELTVFATNPKD